MSGYLSKPAFGSKGSFYALGDIRRLQGRVQSYKAEASKRIGVRVHAVAKRARSVTLGRTMPTLATVPIGSGKQMRIAIVFLDICGFSRWPNTTPEDQQDTLAILNLFLGEMMLVLRKCGGKFEKNTGDGLMGYFGTETADDDRAVHSAVDAAILMHTINDGVISPMLEQNGLHRIAFRIGMEFGDVTISKIGLHGLNSLTAIGSAANTACHIMKCVPDGGIVIGEAACALLPKTYIPYCEFAPEIKGGSDGRAWRLDYRKLCSPLQEKTYGSAT